MAKGSCTCGLCVTRQRPNGWLTPRSERLRGYEIELDSAALHFKPEACKGHAYTCKSEFECRSKSRRGAPQYEEAENVQCDCAACEKEALLAGKKQAPAAWTCPGHDCATVAGDHRLFLMARMKRAVTRAGFPYRGEFGDYAHTARDNEYFEFKTDSSCGYEIATPPLEGPSVVPAIGPIVNELKDIEMRHGINLMTRRCGLHCTFDIQDLGLRDWKQLVFTAYRHQEALLATQPRERRNNDYCRFLPSFAHPKTKRRGSACMCQQCQILRVRPSIPPEERRPRATAAEPRWMPGSGVGGPFNDRRHFINMTNVAKGLVEFRFGGPTTNIQEINAYGVMLECLIDASITRPVLCDSNNRKRRFFEEIIRPYLKDERVDQAWTLVLKPRWEKAELARLDRRGGDVDV